MFLLFGFHAHRCLVEIGFLFVFLDFVTIFHDVCGCPNAKTFWTEARDKRQET